MSESPERAKNETVQESTLQQESVQRKKRKINDKLMKEIKRQVKDPKQRQHIILLIENSLSVPVEAEEILIRNPSAWIKSLSSNFTWTNRELEWYYAEDRFLYAALNEEDCDRWVCVLNWLVQKYQEEDGGQEF